VAARRQANDFVLVETKMLGPNLGTLIKKIGRLRGSPPIGYNQEKPIVSSQPAS
jgi:hypothetical protein